MIDEKPDKNEGKLVSDEIIELIAAELPPFFTRKIATEAMNGLVTEKTLANLEATKQGPKVHRMGRKTIYKKDEFVEWLRYYYGGMYEEYRGFSRIVCRSKDEPAGEGKGSI